MEPSADRLGVIRNLEEKMVSCLESDPSGKSIISTAQRVIYPRSAIQSLSSSSDGPASSSTAAQQDIRSYIRQLIPSPSPEATPSRITTSSEDIVWGPPQVAAPIPSRKRHVESPPEPMSSAPSKKNAAPSLLPKTNPRKKRKTAESKGLHANSQVTHNVHGVETTAADDGELTDGIAGLQGSGIAGDLAELRRINQGAI